MNLSLGRRGFLRAWAESQQLAHSGEVKALPFVGEEAVRSSEEDACYFCQQGEADRARITGEGRVA